MRFDPDIIPICPECENSEHPELDHRVCTKCNIVYCVHYASDVDIRFCGNCLADFRVIETIEIKTTDRVMPNGAVISRKRQVARNIKLEGMDWLFQAQKISTMTDEDILNSIEYHNAIKSLLMNEREERRIVHFKQLSQIKLPTSLPVESVDGKKKRVKVEKKAPDATNVVAALSSLGVNIDPAMLATALANLKLKK